MVVRHLRPVRPVRPVKRPLSPSLSLSLSLSSASSSPTRRMKRCNCLNRSVVHDGSMRGAAASTRAVLRGDGLVGSTFSGGFSSGSVTSVVVSCGGCGASTLACSCCSTSGTVELDGNGGQLVAKIFVRLLLLPKHVGADQRGIDQDDDGRRDRPADKVARIVVLEPGDCARVHFASRVSSATSAILR